MIKFIIIGAILLVRLYLRSKKTQENPNRSPSRQNNPRKPVATTPSLEEILKELSGEVKSQMPEAEPVYTPPVQTRSQREREKIEIEDHQYDFRPEYEHHADLDGPSLAEIRGEIKETQNLEEEEEEITFNFRKAIIAETILNRPQF